MVGKTMRIYRADRFAPPSKSARSKVDPRLDTVALALILIDLVVLAMFALKSAQALPAGGSPNRLIVTMSLFSVIPSLGGLGLWWYMRGKAFIFTFPLLVMSMMLLPGLNYSCAS